MKKLSLIEKLKILIEVSKSSYWFFILIFLLVAIGIVFFTTKKRTAKTNKKIYIGFSLTFLMFILLTNASPLEDFLDYLMNNLFLAILFPDLAIYFTGIIITNIIFWISMLHYNTTELIRKVNIVVYLVLNYLLILLLSVIDTNNLDIFKQNILYENTSATALIELSSGIFILWILFLTLYKINLIYIRKDYKPKVRKVIIKKPIKILPENYEPVSVPNYIFGNPGKRITVVETNPNRFMEDYEKRLTIEDYQLLLKILKEAKAKQKIQIEDELTKSQIMEMKKQEELRENEKYTELEMLYRGIQ